MDLSICKILIKKLKPHPKNARLHDNENIQAIKKSLQTFGQRTPLVVWSGKNYVVKGCGTLQAAKELGWKQISIVRADNFTEDEILSYSIADNKTTDMSMFDFEKISTFFNSVGNVDLQVSTGFTQLEIEPLLQSTWNPSAIHALPMGTEKDEDLSKINCVFSGEQSQFIRKNLECYRQKFRKVEISTEEFLIKGLKLLITRLKF
jgi:hypothetical protein